MRLRNRNWPTAQASATLNLSSDAFAALSLDEMTELGQRCVAMKVRIGAMQGRHRVWKVGVTAWAQRSVPYDPKYHTDHSGYGHLATVLGDALDKYEREHAYTPDELVAIAVQSGIEVSRA